MRVAFEFWTKDGKYGGTVEVTDPEQSAQLESAARTAAQGKGFRRTDVTAYRAFREDGVPLTGKVTVTS